MTITKTVIGVDVGSGSVRAGIFDLNGSLLSHATEKITTTRRSGSRVEQSSQEIWQAVCSCIRNALTLADVCAQSVAGIGFDATCFWWYWIKTVIHCLSARKEMQSKISLCGWITAPPNKQSESMPLTIRC